MTRLVGIRALIAVLCVTAAAATGAAAEPDPQAAVESLSWLEGHWRRPTRK